MSRSKRDILDTEKMLERLATLLAANHKGRMPDGASRRDAEALRRISMTLHNWHELECNGDVIRDEETGKAHHRYGNSYHPGIDREAGALKRLKAIIARYPALQAYVQTGPARLRALYPEARRRARWPGRFRLLFARTGGVPMIGKLNRDVEEAP